MTLSHQLLALLFVAFLNSVTSAQEGPTFADGQDPKPEGKEWQPVELLTDEFEGESLDMSKWQTDPLANGWPWPGRPPALFDPRSVTVDAGKLRVTVGKLEKPVEVKGETFTHRGGIIRSLKEGRPGWYFECKMKANQTVMSSTFWLITKHGGEKRLELDIQECVGRLTEKTDSWAKNWDQTFHSNAISHVKNRDPIRVQLPKQMKLKTKNWERYYVYGAWWKSEHEIRFYLDGKYMYSIEPKVAWDLPGHMQLAVETYDWNPLPDDGGLVEKGDWLQRTTLFEWVRTWELK